MNTAPLLLILAALGWAGNTVAAKLAAPEMSPMLLIFLRWGAVALLVALVAPKAIAAQRHIVRERWAWLLAVGAAISLFNGLFYWAGNYTTAINLGIIQSMIPAFILLAAFCYYKERFSTAQFAGLCLTIIGGALVISRGDFAALLALQFNVGDLIMLCACLFYAAYATGLRSRPPMSAFVMMWYIAVAAWIATIPMALIELALGETRPPAGIKPWLVLAYIVLVPSFLSQVFFMRGVDLIGASHAGLYANLVPVFSAILGVLLLGESPYFYHFAAIALVFCGIRLFSVKKPAAEAKAETETK